ncbi:MAG: MnmC family methyltransferase, partial [Bdellovibrionales bacterium]
SDFLRQQFQGWLGQTNLNDPLHSAYQNILSGVAAKLEIPTQELKEFARASLSLGKLELRASFPQDGQEMSGCSCVFYDAFSKKMNPELWIEEDLQKHLSNAIGPQCVLATYACTGPLNRALRSLGFRLSSKKGFSGKRESTLAIREEIG